MGDGILTGLPNAPSTEDHRRDATADLLLRWYGGRAEAFVLSVLEARAEAGDKPGEAAWAAVLEALRAARPVVGPRLETSSEPVKSPAALPGHRRLFSRAGQAA